MSIAVELYCDDDECDIIFPEGGPELVFGSADEAHEQGWRYDGRDICPDCQRKRMVSDE